MSNPCSMGVWIFLMRISPLKAPVAVYNFNNERSSGFVMTNNFRLIGNSKSIELVHESVSVCPPPARDDHRFFDHDKLTDSILVWSCLGISATDPFAISETVDKLGPLAAPNRRDRAVQTAMFVFQRIRRDMR